jgi:hypothetical protein
MISSRGGAHRRGYYKPEPEGTQDDGATEKKADESTQTTRFKNSPENEDVKTDQQSKHG